MLIIFMAYKIGQKVYLKKTGEKFWINGYSQNKRKREYTISDEYGTTFDRVSSSEFKRKKKDKELMVETTSAGY